MKTIRLLFISLCILLAFSTGAKAEFFSDVILTGTQGIWVDARSYASLNAAITAIGANDREVVIVSPQTVSTLTIPSNVRLRFLRDGSITNSGQLTINTKNISADNRQIFTGVGNIDFTSGTVLRTAWFSNIETAFALTTNDTVTLIVSKPQTITASYSPGTNVLLKWESPGNILTINAGVITGNLKNIEAGNFQLFAGAGDFDFLDGAELNLAWFNHLRSAITFIETEEVTLFSKTPAAVDFTDTIQSNINLQIRRGGILTISTGITLTIDKMDDSGLYQRFSLVGTGTVRFGPGSVKEIVPQWFGASPSATAAVNSAAFQAALDSMGTYPSIPLYIPGASTGSVGNYDINVALTKTSADWIRIRGDGSSSWLEWTGADYATILSLTGEGSGNASVDGVRFDCNDKATTGLALAGFGHGISVTKSEFNDGLANVADNQGMLNIPLDGETHNGLIQRNYFGGGTAIGIGLGLTGASSASGGFDISVNEFQQVKNWAVKAGKIKESTLKTNVIDQILANVNGGGFYLDVASQIDIINNHMEPCAKEFIKLNPTTRYDFKSTTSRILNNLFVGGPLGINLGYTDNVELNGNTSLSMSGENWLTVTANAYGTTIGRNTYSSGVTGTMAWAEQYIGGAGIWNMRYGYTTVASTTAVLTLTNQSASAAWVELTPISTLTEPDIPSDVRAVIVQASIMSATVGARLYMVNEGNAPLWANRATDMRVQYIEAQTASRYNTATFIIPIKNTSYEDAIYYSIDPTGVGDTDVQLRIVGYLMPT